MYSRATCAGAASQCHVRAAVHMHARVLKAPQRRCRPPLFAAGASVEESQEALSADYNEEMNKKMGSSLTYRHEDGMNFAHVLDDLIVGSCLQTPGDLDRLVESEGVGTIMCLQQDSDMEYFDLDIQPILARAAERGDVQHIRQNIRDFDPFSLRINLPGAVREVADAFQAGRGKVYIHCTAGMGRAPALALAYMFWCRGWELQAAYQQLYSVRPCIPKLFAIREATCDLLFGAEKAPARISVAGQRQSAVIEAAGLDIGWGQRVQLEWSPHRRQHSLDLDLLPGRYAYKLIFDGRWSYHADLPTFFDGENTNNYVDVVRASGAAECNRNLHVVRERNLADGATALHSGHVVSPDVKTAVPLWDTDAENKGIMDPQGLLSEAERDTIAQKIRR